jgi:cell division protein FtsB
MQDKEVRTAPNAAFWRPRPRRRLAGRPLTWLLVIGIVVFALASLLGENGLGEYWRLVNQRDRLQQERDELQQASAELEADLQALQNDPEALETLARERYNMRREGEQVIRVLVEPEGD